MSVCATQSTQLPQPICSEHRKLPNQQQEISNFLWQAHEDSKKSAKKETLCCWHQGIDVMKAEEAKKAEETMKAEEAKKAKEADREDGELSDDDEESPALNLMICLPINPESEIIIDQTHGNSSVFQSTLPDQMPLLWTDTDFFIHSKISYIASTSNKSNKFNVQTADINQLKDATYNLWKTRKNTSLLHAVSALFFKLLPLHFDYQINKSIRFTFCHGMNLLIAALFKDFNATDQQLTISSGYFQEEIDKFKEICFEASKEPECLQHLKIEEKCKLVILLEHFYHTDLEGNKYARVILKHFSYEKLIANNAEIKISKGKLQSHSFSARCIWLKTAWNSIAVRYDKSKLIEIEQKLETSWLSEYGKNNCIKHYLSLKILILSHIISKKSGFLNNFKEKINEMDFCLSILKEKFTALNQKDNDFKNKTEINILQMKLELCLIKKDIELAKLTLQKLLKTSALTEKIQKLITRLKELESSAKPNSSSRKMKISQQRRTSRIKATSYSKPYN
ncbi:MAG: hypothetical protein HAW66_05795 [Shewanella sp.]|nr:hypothetical protein [Shewanella sp.]